ncbi:MAG TPA: SBBP repeat-containing protein [Bryobacteraceae bacterium]
MERTAASLLIMCGISHGQPGRQLAASYGNLALSFERNAGQAEGNVLFLARCGAYAIDLTADGMLLEVRGHSRTTTVKMALKGKRHIGNLPSGENDLPGKINYLIGNDPARWHTGVPTFSEVHYRNVYRGIDLIYYGNRSRLEYDFVVAPGADPRSIRMEFEGVHQLAVTRDGDLVAKASGGAVKFRKPVIYQETQGGRKLVAGGFALTGERTVGFVLESYDRQKPLVIDPVLVFSTFLGGSAMDVANAIATDASGNVYVAGATYSPDFPITTGAFEGATKGTAMAGSAFVSKLNPQGTALIYSTYVGGTGGDAANGLAVDSAGDAYIAGETRSKDFPVTSGAFQSAFPGGATSFVAKLNPSGSGLVYATYLGGPGAVSYLAFDGAAAVAIDSSGSAYVAGLTFAPGFPVTPGALQTTIKNELASSAYIAKLNPSGSALVYATFLGGSGQGAFNIGPAVFEGDAATALAVDGSGNAYVTGYAHSADFSVTAGAFQTTNKAATTAGGDSSIPGYNAFISKISPAGSALVFSTYLGGSGVTIPDGSEGNEKIYGDSANAIAVDSAGNVYVAGGAYSADFPVTTGAYQTKLKAVQATAPTVDFSQIGYNAFATKLNSAGSALVYSTFVGGSGSDRANAMAIDASGNASIAGATTSLDFPVTAGAFQTVNKAAVTNNAGTAFVAELNAGGTALSYSTFLGGSGKVNSGNQQVGDVANALALDAADNIYVAGGTWSADFSATQETFQTSNNAAAANGENAFVAKLNPAAMLTGGLPSIRPNLGVVDSASYAPVVAAGGLATIFGYSLANTSVSATGVPLSGSLGGTQVIISGILAPLLYVSPSQINFQVPWKVAGQSEATVVVTTAAGSSSTVNVNLSAVAPAIFTANGSGVGQGSVFTPQFQYAEAATSATRGQYVMIYATGLGAVANQPATGAAVFDASATTTQMPTVTIGGVQASVSFAGLAPGYVGVYQINALVPTTITPGSAVSLGLSSGGMSSKTVTIAVQ